MLKGGAGGRLPSSSGLRRRIGVDLNDRRNMRIGPTDCPHGDDHDAGLDTIVDPAEPADKSWRMNGFFGRLISPFIRL